MSILLFTMAGFYIVAGANHFLNPNFYRPMMPPWIPYHRLMIFLSGVAEGILGISLLFQPATTLAAWGIVALLIVFLPVHFYMLQVRATVFPKIPRAVLIARLPLQGLLIACALYYTQTFSQIHVDRDIVYKSADGVQLTADVYGSGEGPLRPAVVVVHGGSWSSRTGDMEYICRDLAAAGFVAFNITYRLAPEHLYPKALEDVRDAINWVKSNASRFRVDNQRISAWGYSAGANLVLLAAVDGALGLKSVVAGSAPADFLAWPESPIVTKYIGKTLKEDPVAWRQSSPILRVTSQSPPIFLYHGQWDHLVEIEQMFKMETALKSKGVRVETYTAPFMGHATTYLFSRTATTLGIRFLQNFSP